MILGKNLNNVIRVPKDFSTMCFSCADVKNPLDRIKFYDINFEELNKVSKEKILKKKNIVNIKMLYLKYD